MSPSRVPIRIGCCGFPVNKRRYAQFFFVVEVQQTFYQPPQTETLARWRTEVPEDFEFTLKAWQLITHEATSPTYRRLREKISSRAAARYGAFQPTDEVFAAWQRTAEAAHALRARIILFQCPARFTPTAEHIANLRTFFRRIARQRFRFAWEPRGAWEAKTVARLCQELDLIHAVDPFKASPAWGTLNYFRLHGRTGYRYRYTADDLRALLALCRGRKTSYLLFNNLAMFDDARRCQRLLART